MPSRSNISARSSGPRFFASNGTMHQATKFPLPKIEPVSLTSAAAAGTHEFRIRPNAAAHAMTPARRFRTVVAVMLRSVCWQQLHDIRVDVPIRGTVADHHHRRFTGFKVILAQAEESLLR